MPPLRERSTNPTVRPAPYDLSKAPKFDIGATFKAFEAATRSLSASQPPRSEVKGPAAHSTSAPAPSCQHDEEDDEIDIRVRRWNCNEIRSKINNLIRSGEMKVTHFQKHLGINSNSYGRFMKLKGPMGGCDNQTYIAADQFFQLREKAGVKEPKPKKATAADLEQYSVDGIVLDDEHEGEVAVYDTCDDVRVKIQAHLRKPGVTQASFCREIAKTYHKSDPTKKIQPAQLARFLSQKGPLTGNTSSVFYSAYVYFEKMRLKTGAAKSKKRLDVEAANEGGIGLKTNYANQHYFLGPNEDVAIDPLGQVRFFEPRGVRPW